MANGVNPVFLGSGQSYSTPGVSVPSSTTTTANSTGGTVTQPPLSGQDIGGTLTALGQPSPLGSGQIFSTEGSTGTAPGGAATSVGKSGTALDTGAKAIATGFASLAGMFAGPVAPAVSLLGALFGAPSLMGMLLGKNPFDAVSSFLGFSNDAYGPNSAAVQAALSSEDPATALGYLGIGDVSSGGTGQGGFSGDSTGSALGGASTGDSASQGADSGLGIGGGGVGGGGGGGNDAGGNDAGGET